MMVRLLSMKSNERRLIPMTILIQSRPSRGARTLREAIRLEGVRSLLRRRSATSRLRRSSMLLNWGCSGALANPHLNSYQAVCKTVDKRSALIHMKEKRVRVPKLSVNYTPSVDANMANGIALASIDLLCQTGRDIGAVRSGSARR